MIKPIILPKFWNTFQVRLLAYYKICGIWVIRKRNKAIAKKLEENSSIESIDSNENFLKKSIF